ncbi:LysR family transcriptional regulator [Chromobacterium subtsugae]|uniref:LysR family transcriptional regulator n=1 Tax=Chromobacterium subtsugae TaxID=251747 RepID=A0ABS7FEG3_9NEIS|nr:MULTISPECIES: LysR family transcriptional regulator [Chromobacterium]KUM05387.1 LysR family transcriptional regulator [Chromobacterium subtsugae]KZE83689.1 LysR family transcriptional regulator [Chromobacterium sp. F49]MBW7566729.1 LysR family transcriptional regulator [Chromobacterium subtsugae]MBW8288412.1 LysR family transcriptional regulator [Chromobacterium subtsugae]OBU87142.1 LysR family transcriptional regulator [Chromobacterium subtsugae]
MSLQRFRIFAAIVESGSLTAAAEALGHSKAVVSFNLKQLEAELGVALLTRSTRRLQLTETGRRFYQDCLHVLRMAQTAMDDARRGHGGLQGTLSVSTTPEYGRRRVIPALAAFSLLHPRLAVRLESSSRHADLISQQVDVAIRLGSLSDSSYRARLLEEFDIWPVASPGYLAQPDKQVESVDGLARADWLAHSRLAAPLRWKLTGKDGEAMLDAGDAPRIVADTSGALLDFARQGCGVALLPDWQVTDDVAAGALARLLPDWAFPRQGVYAVYPDTRHLPEKVRAFIDFFADYLAPRQGEG